MTEKTALRSLIEAVEQNATHDVVQIHAKAIASAARDLGEYWPAYDVEKTYAGSLDAAKSLHGALIPGWGVELAVAGGFASALVFVDGYRDDFSDNWQTDLGENPCRPWLLAILKAHEDQHG